MHQTTSRGLYSLAVPLAMAMTLASSTFARAQFRPDFEPLSRIEAGTSVEIRTTESISTRNPDGRVFEGIVDRDVFDSSGRLAIPEGSTAELIVRREGNEMVLDLDSILVNGERYAVSTTGSNALGTTGDTSSLGINRETGTYVGGGALLGT